MNMSLANSNKSVIHALMQSIGTSRQRIMSERNRPQVMIRKLEPSVRRTGLIDSGATNHMRPAVADEAGKAHPITITLADGEGEVLQLPNGTLLCSSDNEVIVSLGQLIDVLHCTIEWSPSKSIIRHPLRGLVYCEFGPGGCPVIVESLGLALMKRSGRQDHSLNKSTSPRRSRPLRVR